MRTRVLATALARAAFGLPSVSARAFGASRGPRPTRLLLSIACLVGLFACSAATGAGLRTDAAKRATVFLSPRGSDSNPCTKAAPCRSFNRGYHVARPGQVVQAAGGQYGTQTLLYDAAKERAARNVLIRPARNSRVTIGDLDIGPTRFVKGATHLTVRGMVLAGDISINGCGAPADGQQCPSNSGGNYIDLYNLDVRGPYGFYCASCDHVSVYNSRIGPLTYGSPCNGSAHPEVQNAYDTVNGAKLKRSNHLLFDGDVFENFSRCTSSDHTECLQVEPADDVTIRNSIFRRCDTIVINFANDLAGDSKSAAGYAAPNNILIENNFLDEAMDHTGGPTYYSLNMRECTNCTIRYNSWLQEPRMPTGEISRNNRFVGNLGPMSRHNCFRTGVTYSFNVWKGTRCGSTDRNVATLGFIDSSPGSFNLHLKAGSPAINHGGRSGYPRHDIDGQARPHGSRADAGADERR